MLDGKELEGKIGDVGEYFLDVNDEGVVEIGLSVKVDLIAQVKALAAKTATPVDDQVIAWLAKLLGK